MHWYLLYYHQRKNCRNDYLCQYFVWCALQKKRKKWTTNKCIRKDLYGKTQKKKYKIKFVILHAIDMFNLNNNNKDMKVFDDLLLHCFIDIRKNTSEQYKLTHTHTPHIDIDIPNISIQQERFQWTKFKQFSTCFH